jgi:hypothetical protein
LFILDEWKSLNSISKNNLAFWIGCRDCDLVAVVVGELRVVGNDEKAGRQHDEEDVSADEPALGVLQF